MSEDEADFEVRQSVSRAVLHAIDAASDAGVAKVLLERSDMRFRLKYMLGDWPSEEISRIRLSPASRRRGKEKHQAFALGRSAPTRRRSGN